MTGTLSLGNARIGFRNFEGNEGQYNKAGDRNFVVFLEDEMAKQLEHNGWNVKWPKERDDQDPNAEDTRQPYLPVSLSFTNFPAIVWMIVGDKKTQLSAETVGTLDWSELENVDLVIRPYTWSVNGKSGVKAYLKTGYFSLIQDDFASKYDL